MRGYALSGVLWYYLFQSLVQALQAKPRESWMINIDRHNGDDADDRTSGGRGSSPLGTMQAMT